MEEEIIAVIKAFFAEKEKYNSLLKSNPAAFSPIVFQELKNTGSYKDFAKTKGDISSTELSSQAKEVFSKYVKDNF